MPLISVLIKRCHSLVTGIVLNSSNILTHSSTEEAFCLCGSVLFVRSRPQEGERADENLCRFGGLSDDERRYLSRKIFLV
jgi:hypothetical protein